MTKRELIKTALLSVVAKVGGMLGISAAGKIPLNPLLGVRTYLAYTPVITESVDGVTTVTACYDEVPIELHPNFAHFDINGDPVFKNSKPARPEPAAYDYEEEP